MFSTRSNAAKLALVTVLGLIIIKIVVSIITGSISISAQALDSFLDLFAITITFFAVRFAIMPADEKHPFGHGKAESIAATVQAILIFITGSLIIYSAIRRIITDNVIELAEAGIGVMLISITVSIFLSRHLLKVSRDTGSIALEATARNLTADIFSASGVLVAMVTIRFTKLSIIDPIIAIGVSIYIMKTGYDIVKGSFGELLDVVLPREEQQSIISCIKKHHAQLAGYHKIRTRRSGGQRFVDFHLVIPKNTSLEVAHQMCYHLEEDIESRLPRSNVTIHIEPCTVECKKCSVVSCNIRQV